MQNERKREEIEIREREGLREIQVEEKKEEKRENIKRQKHSLKNIMSQYMSNFSI